MGWAGWFSHRIKDESRQPHLFHQFITSQTIATIAHCVAHCVEWTTLAVSGVLKPECCKWQFISRFSTQAASGLRTWGQKFQEPMGKSCDTSRIKKNARLFAETSFPIVTMQVREKTSPQPIVYIYIYIYIVYILSSLVVTTRKSTKKRTGQNAKYCGCLSWLPPKARKKKHENKHEKERKNARKKAR